jgi:ribosomal protein L16 Arg81 hydroxylase
MTCQFLDTFTVATLLAPATEETFRVHHWERAPLVVHRRDPDYYGNLFTLEDFDRELASTPTKVVTTEAKGRTYTRYEGKISAIPFERVLAEMRDGKTLLLEHLQHRNPNLGRLCRLLEQQLGHRFWTNLYLTPPHGQGLLPHWDNHDTIILQVLGQKHWKIEKRRRKLPIPPEQMYDENREIAPGSDSFTLDQGDMIYIPRGFVHAAECGSAPSLHITIGVFAYTWGELLKYVVTNAILEDDDLRLALPLGFMGGGDGLGKGLTAVLRKIADEKYTEVIVERFKDDMVTRSTLDISGQVIEFYRAAPLRCEDRIGPRPGIIYRLHIGDNSTRLNFGTRTIVFPDLFREALVFALKFPVYAVAELPGELEDEEKIVFAERLIQEGLVVRK